MGSVDDIIERTHGGSVAPDAGVDGTEESAPRPETPGTLRRRLPPYNVQYASLSTRVENIDYDGLGFVMSVFSLAIRIMGMT